MPNSCFTRNSSSFSVVSLRCSPRTTTGNFSMRPVTSQAEQCKCCQIWDIEMPNRILKRQAVRIVLENGANVPARGLASLNITIDIGRRTTVTISKPPASNYPQYRTAGMPPESSQCEPLSESHRAPVDGKPPLRAHWAKTEDGKLTCHWIYEDLILD